MVVKCWRFILRQALVLAEDFRPDLLRPALAAALGPAILPAAAATLAPPMMLRGGTLAASRSLHSLQARVSHTWPCRIQFVWE